MASSFPAKPGACAASPGCRPRRAPARPCRLRAARRRKLFAFGYDAWLLTAYLERLATRADGNVQGATGTLRIDGFGNVVRTPAWSTFSGGIAVPLGHDG